MAADSYARVVEGGGKGCVKGDLVIYGEAIWIKLCSWQMHPIHLFPDALHHALIFRSSPLHLSSFFARPPRAPTLVAARCQRTDDVDDVHGHRFSQRGYSGRAGESRAQQSATGQAGTAKYALCLRRDLIAPRPRDLSRPQSKRCQPCTPRCSVPGHTAIHRRDRYHTRADVAATRLPPKTPTATRHEPASSFRDDKIQRQCSFLPRSAFETSFVGISITLTPAAPSRSPPSPH